MTDPKITEAVARAMYDACPLHKDGPAWGSPALDEDRGYAMTKRRWYLHEAQAAITAYREAMNAAGRVEVPREPTKAMLLAGETASENTHDGSRSTEGWVDHWDDMEVANACYRAMIEASEEG